VLVSSVLLFKMVMSLIFKHKKRREAPEVLRCDDISLFLTTLSYIFQRQSAKDAQKHMSDNSYYKTNKFTNTKITFLHTIH
jgi:hypothetical protein